MCDACFWICTAFVEQHVKIRRPDDEKLYCAVHHVLPSHMDIVATVCDSGEGRAHRQDIRLGDLDKGTST